VKRDYRIRAVCYGTDGQVTAGNPTRKMIPCLRELEALLRALPGVEVAAYTMDKLKKTMYWTAHNKLATGPTCGHLSWKPYIIMRELMDVDDCDVVWYLDADVRWHPGVDILARFVDLAKDRGIALRNFGCTNAHFARREMFVLMGMDEPRYREAPHLTGAMMAFERSNRTLQFVQDWLVASLSYDVIAKKIGQEHKESDVFLAHRTQSVLSILAVHYDIEPYQIDGVFFSKGCSGDPPGYEKEKPWTYETGRQRG